MRLLIFLFITNSFSLTAQQVTKDFFKATSWFVNDKDSAFNKNDSLKLIKYENFFSSVDQKINAENESKFLGHGDYLKIEMKKNGELYFTTIRNNYIGTIDGVKRYWKYSKKHNNLIFYDKGKIIAVFEPISINKIIIPSRQSGVDKIETIEVKCNRIRN
jgi:hypothetical protein